MQATDRILLLNHYNLLMKSTFLKQKHDKISHLDEKNQPVWRNKKILIIQDAVLFFDPDINVSNGELTSIFYNEKCKFVQIK